MFVGTCTPKSAACKCKVVYWVAMAATETFLHLDFPPLVAAIGSRLAAGIIKWPTMKIKSN